MVGVAMETVIKETQNSVRESRLYKCNTCEALAEFHIAPEWLRPGGTLYQVALQTYGTLTTEKSYNFTVQGTFVHSFVRSFVHSFISPFIQLVYRITYHI